MFPLWSPVLTSCYAFCLYWPAQTYVHINTYLYIYWNWLIGSSEIDIILHFPLINISWNQINISLKHSVKVLLWFFFPSDFFTNIILHKWDLVIQAVFCCSPWIIFHTRTFWVTHVSIMVCVLLHFSICT